MDRSVPPASAAVRDIIQRASRTAFGKPLITNVLRGHIVEAIIEAALSPEWRLCSEDYASWDFERADGTRIEVKQSASRQSWWLPGDKPSKCRFDIASRQYAYIDKVRVQTNARAAHVYVFAHHPIIANTADHRDPAQWVFYVVAESRLPATKQISLISVKSLSEACDISILRQRVEELATR